MSVGVYMTAYVRLGVYVYECVFVCILYVSVIIKNCAFISVHVHVCVCVCVFMFVCVCVCSASVPLSLHACVKQQCGPGCMGSLC